MSAVTENIVKHTEGPWRVEKETFDPLGHSAFPWRVKGPGPEAVVYAQTIVPEVWGRDDTNRKYNAYLIAAAPELLEALKNLLAECEVSWCVEEDELGPNVEAARAAIAKAEGRES